VVAETATFAQTVNAPRVLADSLVSDTIAGRTLSVTDLAADHVASGKAVVVDLVAGRAVVDEVAVRETLSSRRGVFRLATIDELHAADIVADDVQVSGVLTFGSASATGAVVCRDVEADTVRVSGTVSGAVVRADDAHFATLAAREVVAESLASEKVVAGLVEGDVLVAREATSDRATVGVVEARTVVAIACRASEVRADSVRADEGVFLAVDASSVSMGDGRVSGTLAAGDVAADHIRVGLADVTAANVDHLKANDGEIRTARIGDAFADRCEIAALSAGTASVSQGLVVDGDVRCLSAVDASSMRASTLDADVTSTRCLQADSVRARDVYAVRCEAGIVDAGALSVGSATISHGSSVTFQVSDGLDASRVRARTVDVDDSARITGTLDAERTETRSLQAGALEADSTGVAVRFGILDARQASSTLLGDTRASSVSATTMAADAADIDRLCARELTSVSTSTAALSVTNDAVIGGNATVAGSLVAGAVATGALEASDATVHGVCALRGDVVFTQPVLELPVDVRCADALSVAGEVTAGGLSSTTLVVSRIVIGPAGMSFV
jgi:hypothetical protein